MSKRMSKQIDKIETKEYLDCIAEGYNLTKLANHFNVSPTATHKRLKRYEYKEWVIRIEKNPALYELTGKGRGILYTLKHGDFNLSSLGERTTEEAIFSGEVNLHNLKIKIPIIHRKKDVEMPKGKRINLNNWYKEIHKVDAGFNLTLELTKKNVILHFEGANLPRNYDFFPKLYQFYTSGTFAAYYWLRSYGIDIDIAKAKIINQHIANTAHEAINKGTDKKSVVEMKLGRKAVALTGSMNQEAIARIDRSKGPLHFETNDNLYENQILNMPQTVQTINANVANLNDTIENKYLNSIALYDTQIQAHLAVIKKINETMAELRDGMAEFTRTIKRLKH